MTANNITTEALDRIECAIAEAQAQIRQINRMAWRGEIRPKQAASMVNAIGLKLAQEIYPEDNK